MQSSAPEASGSGSSEEIGKEEEWTAKEVHLTDNKVSELPQSPSCPTLIALYLQGNSELTAIPPLFFKSMALLQVLDLSGTSIKSLPESIIKLVALRKLSLQGCKLFMELSPEVGKLKNLEDLDLDETQIMDLPREIGELLKLSHLKVSFYHVCGKKKSKLNTLIDPETMSILSRLTELSIDVDPTDKRWDDSVEAVVKEISKSKSLRSVNLYLPKFQLLDNTSFIYPSLSRFRFTVGHQKRRIISRVPHEVEAEFKKWDKCLKFVNGENIPIEIKEVLKYSTSFFLDRHATAMNLSGFGIENMNRLKFCLLADCNNMETLIDGGMHYERNEDDQSESHPVSVENVLESLEYMSIYYMENLESIWRGPNPYGCMSKLKFLALHTCPQLTYICSHSLLENFVNLEEFIVEDCPQVTSLVSRASVEPIKSDKIFLPSLKRLLLLYLPELISISNGLLIAPKLETIGFYNCPKLTRISKKEFSSKALQIIKGECQWWEDMKWNETEWGSLPDYLMHIFCPIDNEKDVMTQLAENTDLFEATTQNEGQQPGYGDAFEASVQDKGPHPESAGISEASVQEVSQKSEISGEAAEVGSNVRSESQMRVTSTTSGAPPPLTVSASFKESGGKGSSRRRVVRPSFDADNEFITLLHGSDPVKVELNRLENEVRGKDRELGEAQAEIKALRMSERLRQKAVEELTDELSKMEEKLKLTESLLESKNLEIKKINDEKKASMAAQFAAEATLRRVHAAQKDDDMPPIEAILAPLEAELKLARQEIAKLQDDNKALDRLTKSKEAALLEAERTVQVALAKASMVDDLQNKNQELMKQIEICQEENKILDKMHRQKVAEVEKLTQTVRELEEAVLAGGAAANAVRDYQRKVQEMNEEKKTLDRELAHAKVTANRVITVVANEWKDANDKVMPVKQWLEERRFLQGEMQQLRDKLAITERAAKSEARLKEKYQLRLKVLEDSLRGSSNSVSCSTSDGRSMSNGPSRHQSLGGADNFSKLTSNGFLSKRSPSSQLGSSLSSSSVLKHAKGTSKSFDGGTRSLDRAKVLLNGAGLNVSFNQSSEGTKEGEAPNNEKPNDFLPVDTQDNVPGVLYDLLQKEVVALRKAGHEKDQGLKDKDDAIEMLAKKVETLTKAMEVEAKKMRREVAAMEIEVSAMRVEKEHENRAKRFGNSNSKGSAAQLLTGRNVSRSGLTRSTQ
ncbi:hypothetical protein PTKIN_Ptkin04bG0049600 [Pterospermum kingtungense]